MFRVVFCDVFLVFMIIHHVIAWRLREKEVNEILVCQFCSRNATFEIKTICIYLDFTTRVHHQELDEIMSQIGEMLHKALLQ